MKDRRAIQLNEREFEEILNLPAHVVAIISDEGTFYKTNAQSHAVLGWTPQDLEGKTVWDLVHPEDVNKTREIFGELISGLRPEISGYEIRCQRIDKEYRWVSWNARSQKGLIYAMGVDINEKIKAEEILHTQSKILESISEGVVICNKEGTIFYVNPAEEEMFGHNANELTGQNISMINEQIQLKEIIETLQTKKIWKGEWESKRKDGGLVYISCRITSLNISGVDHLVCVQRDITEEKRFARQHEILSDRLGLTVKAGNIGIWEWMPSTSTLYWDETTERIYGYETGTFEGTQEAYIERIWPEDRETLWSTVMNSLKSRQSYEIDHRITHKSGQMRWVQCSGLALYDNNGNSTRVMGTIIDITDRKEAAQDQKFLARASEILSSSFNYKNTLNALGELIRQYLCDGIVIDLLHPDGRIERIVALHPEASNGERLIELQRLFPSRYEKEHPLFTALITGRVTYIQDVESHINAASRVHGEAYIEEFLKLNMQSVIVTRLKGQENLLGTMSLFTVKGSKYTITDRHRWFSKELSYRVSMALENALLYQSSQEAIRARDEFLSIASHELKTPLTSLTLQNLMLKRQLDKNIESFDREKFRKRLDGDHRQLIRINRLIDDMLDISRIRAGRLLMQKDKYLFCQFVNDVLERFRPQMEAAGCDLSSHFCEEIEAHYDSYRIEQVLINLLTNAMRYGAGRPIKVEVLSFPRGIKVLIHDQGPGIAEEDCERIFQRFERAVSSNEVSGLGLGLYISRQIMDQHNGLLSVKSELGRGSTFVLELPL